MYDIKRIEYYVKHPEEIRISKKWMLQRLDCTPAGRLNCEGFCCYNKDHVMYSEEEFDTLPDFFKIHTKDRVVKNKDGICELIDLCLKHPEYKPLACKLIPLTIDKNGILRIQYGAICGGCPNFKKGDKPVYVTMKEDIIHIFGQEFYDRLVEELI